MAKRRGETDMKWVDIRDMLGLQITPDQLRKQAVGYEKVYNYFTDKDTAGIKTRILSISDAHVPFNLPIDIFAKYSHKVDVLVFNGDIEDCWSCSKFPRMYRLGFEKEMVLVRQYMIDVINLIRPKHVVVLMGNHEARLGRYLSVNLNEDLLAIMPDSPLDLIVNEGFHVRDRMNKTDTYYSPLVELYKEQNINITFDSSWYTKIGHVIFAHPLSYSSAMLKTTEKAVNYFLRVDRDFSAICLGHTHKLGSYKQGNILMYEQGCCCDLSKLDYADGKLVLPGQNGFLYLCLDDNGDVIENKTLLETL